jgi:hypothetical protein
MRGYETASTWVYSVVYGPEPMPPAYAALETRPLAPDDSGGSASTFRLVYLQVVGRE